MDLITSDQRDELFGTFEHDAFFSLLQRSAVYGKPVRDLIAAALADLDAELMPDPGDSSA